MGRKLTQIRRVSVLNSRLNRNTANQDNSFVGRFRHFGRTRRLANNSTISRLNGDQTPKTKTNVGSSNRKTTRQRTNQTFNLKDLNKDNHHNNQNHFGNNNRRYSPSFKDSARLGHPVFATRLRFIGPMLARRVNRNVRH